MRTALLIAASLVALSFAAAPAVAEDRPCAGTPQNNCRPLCETGDIRDCIGDPQPSGCVKIGPITFCP